MKALLIVTAVLEAATGVGFLLSPPVGFRLLLGASLDTPGALAIARVAGAALLALGLACWLAIRDVRSRAARGVVAAMLLYNAAVVAVLLHAGIGLGLLDAGPWPAAGLHTAMALWCVASLRKSRLQDETTR